MFAACNEEDAGEPSAYSLFSVICLQQRSRLPSFHLQVLIYARFVLVDF